MNSSILEIKKMFFDKLGFELLNVETEKEGINYRAHRFEINDKKIIFRQAKITPTKIGQFVTLWKRNIEKETIEPFDVCDKFDLIVINVKKDNLFGQFVFPKSIMIEKGIITNKKEGKRAMRVYPIWDVTNNKQAMQTQKWQLDYFLQIQNNGYLNINRAKLFYSINA